MKRVAVVCFASLSLALCGCRAALPIVFPATLPFVPLPRHEPPPPRPVFPAEARRQGIDGGYVMAALTADAHGRVAGVEILEASSPLFVEEARHFFVETYKYGEGAEGRRSVEILRFSRRNGF